MKEGGFLRLTAWKLWSVVTGIHVLETVVRQRVMVAGTCKKVYTQRQIRRKKQQKGNRVKHSSQRYSPRDLPPPIRQEVLPLSNNLLKF